MGVEYGLGGFKAGTAFIYATFTGSAESLFAAVNTPVAYGGGLTKQAAMGAKINDSNNSVIDLDKSGYYLINYSVTTNGGNNKDYKVNLSTSSNSYSDSQGGQSFNSKAGDLWTTSGCMIMKIQNTRNLYFLVENLSDDTSLTITTLNISVIRLGGLHSNTKEYVGGTAYGSLYAAGGTITYAATDVFYPFGITLDSYNMLQMNNKNNAFEIEQSGYYYFYGSFSISGNSNDDLQVALFKNGTGASNLLVSPKQKWNSKGGSRYQTGFSAVFQLKKGDTIQPGIANNTDTTGTTTFQQVNLVMSRIGNI